MILDSSQDSFLEITTSGNVKMPSSGWGKPYEFAGMNLYFFVRVLQDIFERCPMALVDLHFLCEKGRMNPRLPLKELKAMLASVPLVTLSRSNDLVLNVRDPQVPRFLLDTILINGFTAYLNPKIVDAAKRIEGRLEDFPQLPPMLQLPAACS